MQIGGWLIERKDLAVAAGIVAAAVAAGWVYYAQASPGRGSEAPISDVLVRSYDRLVGTGRAACVLVGEVRAEIAERGAAAVPLAKSFLAHVEARAGGRACEAERQALAAAVREHEGLSSERAATDGTTVGRAQAFVAAHSASRPNACADATATARRFATLLADGPFEGRSVRVLRNAGWLQVTVDAGDDRSAADEMVRWIRGHVREGQPGSDALVTFDRKLMPDEDCNLSVAVG